MKKLKLTTKTIMNLSAALLEIGNFKFKDAPLTFIMAIGKNTMALEPIVTLFEKTRQKIVKDCAKLDEDGNILNTEDNSGVVLADPSKFAKDLEELYNVEHDVELTEFDQERFESHPDITANLMMSLSPIIKE